MVMIIVIITISLLKMGLHSKWGAGPSPPAITIRMIRLGAAGATLW